jgi:geranylgeranyl pyrophosphate synthase
VELVSWLEPRMSRLEEHLRAALSAAWPGRFAEALHYPLFGGGKRVRPAITFAACEAVDGEGRWEPALAAAMALELVHTYSLVHDDLPCMDDDDLRRGRPTVHKVYGEGPAVLVGDGLLTEAFAVLATAPHPAEVRVEMVRRLAVAARDMVGGQACDIGLDGPVTTVEALTRLHAGKTGALIAAASGLGALSAGAEPDQLARVEAYGRAVGLAFQLADDVLDADQDDHSEGPPSFVKLLGIEETRRRARALAAEAEALVAPLRHPGALVALARFTVDRSV